MVKQQAQDAAFGARLFYNGITILSVATFLYYDNNLQKSILEFDFLYFIPYFALLGISYYLYYACGENPGFIDLPKNSGAHIELSVGHEGNESLLPSEASSSSATGLALDHQTREDTIGKEDIQEIQTSKGDKPNNPMAPDLWFCDKCNLSQPYRSKHCNLCERCVHKFDHHCFWIGTCVGELNHRKFWIFLFFQSILELWSYYIADSGLDASYKIGAQNIKAGDTTGDSPYKTSEYGAFMTTTVVMIGTFVFTTVLLGFHTFLILTNQTTWEVSKRSRISYLKGYPSSFNPFSEGLLGNIKLIFLHGNRIKDWELPPIENFRRKKGFNWCDNKYWSCC
jgi:palmitoyltransferase